MEKNIRFVSLFKYCLSDRKEQIFQIDKTYFADVASSYGEKIRRSISGKAAFAGRIIIFKQALIFSLVLFSNQAFAQLIHSHNDYEQKQPFYAAYDLGFDSIEADLYIKNGKLYVAHDEKNITRKRTFKALYWKPLLAKIRANEGYAYPNHKELYLLLDLKKEGKQILAVLEKLFKHHRKDLQHVHITISGDMPKPEEFEQYDKILFFDGRRNTQYSEKAYERVDMVSASFLDFGKYWPGKQELPEETYQNIRAFVLSNHAKGKRVRVWGTPNTTLAFETLKKLQVDFIGTDDLDLLKNFVDK